MQKIKTDKMLSEQGRLNDEQFKVLFFIYNSINLNSDHTNRAKIYRAVLADLTGKSERTISRITDKLAEQGLIVKDSVSDGSKLYNYYSIPKKKLEANLVTDDRVKEHKELKVIKEPKVIKESKELKEEKVENEFIFKVECKVEKEEGLTVDDFDYTSMDEDFLEECEKAMDEDLIPTEKVRMPFTVQCK